MYVCIVYIYIILNIYAYIYERKAERGEDHMQKYLHDHFLSEDHDGLLNNVEITLIDKTDPSDPERREEFWRTKLRTLAPLDLNIEE